MASQEEEAEYHHHPFAFFHSYSSNNHHHFHHVDVEDEDHPHHPLNLSRLSMCTGGTDADNEEEEEDDEIEKHSNDGDADDEEFSLPSSDSEKEGVEGVCLSLPSTPTRRRIRGLSVSGGVGVKEYVSETEALETKMRQRRRERRSSFLPEKWLERSNSEKKKAEEDEQQSGEGECVVITRPKGGRRSLCMDTEEVKACKDLGFELENEKTQMIEIPSRLTVSCSAFEFNDTSSGGNSPISNWKISSPGDDPKEVKARLKVWAQAVALAASPH